MSRGMVSMVIISCTGCLCFMGRVKGVSFMGRFVKGWVMGIMVKVIP